MVASLLGGFGETTVDRYCQKHTQSLLAVLSQLKILLLPSSLIKSNCYSNVTNDYYFQT